MAERRMFAKTIVLSDAFLDMPLSARCLYFTLGMLADDDGFVNSPKSVMRQVGASMDDMNILIGKKFVLTFDSGVIVIKHWRIHNYIQKDRYKESKYIDEKASLTVDEKGAYTECIQNVSKVDTQVRLGEVRGRVSIGQDSVVESTGGEESAPSYEEMMIAHWREHGIMLTLEESKDLEEKLTSDIFNRYFNKLQNFLKNTPTAQIRSQHDLILRWAKEDGCYTETK